MVARRTNGKLDECVFKQQLHELEVAHAATGPVYWKTCREPEPVSVFSRNAETGAAVSIVAEVRRENDARFIELAHELVPHLLAEYRFLAAYYDKRQRETFTS